jgi:hypothetical protein
MIELRKDQYWLEWINAGRLPFSLALQSGEDVVSLISYSPSAHPPVLRRIQPFRIEDNGEQDRTWLGSVRGGGDEIGD